MAEYTVATIVTMLVVILLEALWARTGIFSSVQYWVSMAIMLSFQVLVDGWLTKLSNPIVIYRESAMSGVRFPWDIPIEDFGFGFAMITFTILIWKKACEVAWRRKNRVGQSMDERQEG
ncbi:lycopene cyclase domain-containing protein [Galactobacter sp.]|uniref:lycopene cyclase domain-containing protein n=1 Tax=Galactobacter sp. TaxID=2676125 RepID=UPI0025C0ACBB|nr:lycopene cyclase domain-containing protein [Galactobacter sp.]